MPLTAQLTPGKPSIRRLLDHCYFALFRVEASHPFFPLTPGEELRRIILPHYCPDDSQPLSLLLETAAAAPFTKEWG
jgi:hypothetical protein